MKPKLILKILISSVLLCLIFRKIDFSQLAAVLQNVNLLWVFLSLLISLISIFFGVFRLKLFLLPELKKKISFLSLLEIYWISMFFNLFLPSQVAGDVVKAYKLSGRSGMAIESTAAILMDRVVGLTSMLFIAVLALVFGRYSFDVSIASRSIVIILSGCMVFYFLIFNKKVIQKFGLFSFEIIQKIYNSFHAYRNRLNVLIKAFFISLIINAMVFAGSYFLAKAVGINLPLVYFFILMPLITVISVLPVSISGIGLQDGAIVFFFSQLGIAPASALALSLLAHILRLIMGFFGGLVYLFEKKF